MIVTTLEQAAAEHPELVERHLGTVVTDQADMFVARNDADFSGGAFVYVPAGVAVPAPILLTAIQAQSGTELHRRTLIVLEAGAQAEVWEQALSGSEDTEGVFNTVVELVVGDNAQLRYISGQDLTERSWIFGTHRAELGRDGALDWVALGFGSGAATFAWRPASAARAPTLGSPAPTRPTSASTSTSTPRRSTRRPTRRRTSPSAASSGTLERGLEGQHHRRPRRAEDRRLPGVAQPAALQAGPRRRDPGLEIQANDVRCTHAAAVAQVDPEQLFYLRSHGLPEPEAKRLVIEGFLAALVERFEAGPVRELLGETLERRLALVLGG